MISYKKMRKYYNYSVDEVMWGFTYANHIEGEFGKVTEEYDSAKELLKQHDPDFTPKHWTVYKCRSCDFITHALRKPIKEEQVVSKLGNFDAAVVTSIPVAHSKQ